MTLPRLWPSIPLGIAATPLPPTRPEQTWQLGAFTAVTTYMCVRGRAGAAWLVQCLVAGTFMLWTELHGDGAAQGLAMAALNFGPLFMATLFAFTISPAAAKPFVRWSIARDRRALQRFLLAQRAWF